MKEYKYKINGNEYNVAVDNIEGNIAHIQVNGVAYDVELPEQPKAAPAVKRVAVSDAPAAAPKPAARKAAPAAGGPSLSRLVSKSRPTTWFASSKP